VIKKYQKFVSEYSGKVFLNESLTKYCTFEVGGSADLLIKVKTPELLVVALKLARDFKIPYFILAVGSNVFFDDKGYRGLII
jgi:UDP-N-acetylmuramate dehydrogenase